MFWGAADGKCGLQNSAGETPIAGFFRWILNWLSLVHRGFGSSVDYFDARLDWLPLDGPPIEIKDEKVRKYILPSETAGVA